MKVDEDSCLERVRAKTRAFCEHSWFEYVVTFFIVVSSVFLVLSRPSLDPDSPEGQLLYYSGYVFVALFAAEMLIKMFAFGLFFGENAYFTVGWNILDFLVVIASALALRFESIAFLRVFRALRPLRLVNRRPQLKMIVNCLGSALSSSASILTVGVLVWLVFGIVGVQLFSGKFYGCDVEGFPEGGTREYFVEELDGNWVKLHRFSFDNIFSAALTLFEVASMEMWPDIMYAAVDSTSPTTSPKLEENIGKSRVWAVETRGVGLAERFRMHCYVFLLRSGRNLLRDLPFHCCSILRQSVRWYCD